MRPMHFYRIDKEQILVNFILVLVLSAIILYCIYSQFINPTFHEPDEYYHIAVTRFIRDFGPHYNFRWAQFSTFKKFFSDKDFLFHLFTVPFLSLSKNLILDGKYAIVFYNVLFLIFYTFILRRYLPPLLTACFLLLPFINFTFFTYFIRLRPVTLANILTILGIYFLINKRWISVFIISFLYSLSHISFFTILIFALGCEFIRLRLNKTFFVRNIYAAMIGILLGCLLHPNNPNNWLSFHLNTLLVPLYTSVYNLGGFGNELYSFSLKSALTYNFTVFLILYFVIWAAFITRIKLSLSTFVWWACSSFYLILSFFGIRYWYVTNVLFFIFFASYVKDWMAEKPKELIASRVRFFSILCSLVVIMLFPANLREQKNLIQETIIMNTHFENMARWMEGNIPAGENVYHSGWSDSPYFILLNPKNNYILVLDPIYMFYARPKMYQLYQKLNRGNVKKPYKFLKHIFKVDYGYTGKGIGLYFQIRNDVKHFKIVYEDNLGIIFKILG